MKPGRIQEVSAAVFVGVGVINCVSAISANTEAVKANVNVATLEAQGNYNVTEWQDYADNKEDDRNYFLFLVAADLVAATLLGVGAATSIASSRRREQATDHSSQQ